ncbi:MAG TPA: hypothetical protein VFE60_01845 [Roseiarcus sp.]|nr:hypothetical protein [Roseiarcus sp.]
MESADAEANISEAARRNGVSRSLLKCIAKTGAPRSPAGVGNAGAKAEGRTIGHRRQEGLTRASPQFRACPVGRREARFPRREARSHKAVPSDGSTPLCGLATT